MIAAGAGSAHVDFTLTPTNDAIDEPDEMISIEGSLAGVTFTQATITITDDDDAPTTLTLSVDVDTGTNGTQNSIAEDGGAKTVRVTATLGGATRFTEARTVTVEVGHADDSATEGTDYTTVATQTVTIAAGQASAHVDFTLMPMDDALVEGSETISVTGAVTGLAVTDTEITLTDGDDVAPTALTLSLDADTGTDGAQNSIAEDGGAQTVRVKATLDGAGRFTEPKTVTIEVGKNTDSATEGTDYTTVATQTITIAAGAASGHVDFTLTPTDDNLAEGAETISVEGSVSGLTVASTTITLTDDEGAPTLSLVLTPSAINETGDGNSATVTATLSAASTTAVTVTVSAAPGTDTKAGDYTLSQNTTLSFAAGSTNSTGTVTITAVDNSVVDPGKTVTVSGAATGGGVANPADVTLSIVDDDAAGLTLNPTSLPMAENTSTQYTVALATRPSASVAVTITGHDETDLTLDKTSLTFTTTNWNEAQTVTVTVGEDDDGVEDSVTLTHSAAGGGYDSKTAELLVTITDNDTPGIDLSVSSLTVAEGGSKGYTVALLTRPSTQVTVAVTGYADTNLTLDKTSLTFTTANWNEAQTVTVSAGQDDDGISDTETLTHTAAGGEYDGKTAELTVHATDTYTAPAGVTLTAQPDTVTENGGAQTVRVTATVDGSTHFLTDQTVSVSVGGGTAVATTDYATVAGFDITIEANATSGSASFTLTPVNNSRDEQNKTIQVTGALSGVTVTGDEITLTDDDGAPEVEISGVTVTEGETANFTVSLSAVSGKAVTVTATTADGSAVAPGDYTHRSGTVTIAAGSLSAGFAVPTTDDTNAEQDETFTVRLTSPNNATLKANGNVATGTIRNDDIPLVLSIDDVSVNEGQAADFMIHLSAPSDRDITVTATTMNGGAMAPDDYTHTSSTVRIPAGERSATFSVPTVEDTVAEGDETFTVRLSNPVNADIGDGAGTGAITDDDAQPEPMELQVSVAQAREGEPMTFDVYIVPAARTAFTLNYFTRDYSAEAGLDYTPIESGSMTIVGGVSARQITVQTLDDLLVEPNERFRLELWVSGNRDVAAVATTGTIIDDDEYPVINIGGAEATEGEPLRFPVSLSTIPAESLSVAWTVTPGTAAPDADYTAVSGVLDIPAGQQRGVIEVAGLQDRVDEPDKTLTVTLSDPQRVVLGEVVTATGTIKDDDEPPLLTLAAASVPEGLPLRFPVRLSGVSAYPISVDWAVAPGTAIPAEDYEVASGTLSIPAGEDGGVITVVTLQDLLDEVDETLTVTLSAPQQARLGEAATALGTIRDDDEAPVLKVADEAGGVVVADEAGGVVVAEEGQALVFELILSAPSARAISVDWAVTPGTATLGEDYLAASGVITLAPGETAARVEVATLDDNVLEEAQETVLLVLSNPVNVTVDGSATGHIADNDAETVQRLEETNKAILPQVTAALTRARIEQVTACLGGDSPARSAGATLGSLLQRLPASSAELRDDDRSLWERLGGTRFKTRLKPDEETAPGEEIDSGVDITVCGGLDWRHLGDARRGLDWDGELYGAHLGGYIRLSETDRLGVNVSQSYVSLDYEGGDYQNADGAAQDNTAGGEWELSLTGVQPYYSKQWQDGHSLWAMAGWGTGELTLTEAGLRQASDATAWQAALGGVLPLQWGQGRTGEWARSVHLKSDLWWGRLALDGNDELLQALDSSTVGGRAMLESLHERELHSGAGLSLETGAGLRYDDGAGDAGLEWTGGLGYRSAGRRFEADIDARALLLSGDTEEWGFSAQARLTPRVDGSGWSFTLAPGWGQTNSMAEALWAGEWTAPQAGLGRSVRRAGMDPDSTVADTYRSRAVAPTFNAEIGYGIRLPWQQGLLTPYSAFTSGSSGEQIQMGLHWSLRPHLRFELDAEYQPGNGAGREDAGLFLRYVVGN